MMKLRYIMLMLIISVLLLFFCFKEENKEENKVIFFNYFDTTSEIARLKKNEIVTIKKKFRGEILKVIGNEEEDKYLFYLRNYTEKNSSASVYIELDGNKIKYDTFIADYPVIYKSPFFYLNSTLFSPNNKKLYDLDKIINCINNNIYRKHGVLPKKTRVLSVNDTGIIFFANFIKEDHSRPNSFPDRAFDKNYDINRLYLSSDSIRKYFNAFIKFSIFFTEFRLNNIKLISEFNHYHANIFHYDNKEKLIYVYCYSSTEDPEWNYDKIFILNEKFNRINEIKLHGIYQYKPYYMYKFKNNIILLNPDSVNWVKNKTISKMDYSEIFDAAVRMKLNRNEIKNILL